MDTNASLAHFTEQQLLQRFASLVDRDRTNTAQLLAHIAEIDERKLWAKHACSSMFAFCMERFHMSESATAKRLRAARLARRFPVVLSMIAAGELHVSGANQLGKHLTEENHEAVLVRAKHKSSREIELLVAELAPRPDVASRVRALPRFTLAGGSLKAPTASLRNAFDRKAHWPLATSTRGEFGKGTQRADITGAQEAFDRETRWGTQTTQTSQPAPTTTTTRKQIEPLAPRRFRIEITVDQTTHDQLRALQDLLRHQLPSGDPAVILSRAVKLLFDDTLKKKAAITKTARPGAPASTKRTRTIPAAVRRGVWTRDVGRCAFVDQKGRRCRATGSLEFHHEIPFGKGGRHEVKNIALRCRGHNQFQADLDFGREFMRSKREQAARPVEKCGGHTPRPATVLMAERLGGNPQQRSTVGKRLFQD